MHNVASLVEQRASVTAFFFKKTGMKIKGRKSKKRKQKKRKEGMHAGRNRKVGGFLKSGIQEEGGPNTSFFCEWRLKSIKI